MSTNTSFPANSAEALAYLYVQSREDLSSKTASEIADLYQGAYKEIKKHQSANDNWQFK